MWMPFRARGACHKAQDKKHPRRVSHPAVTKSGRKRKTAFPTARPVHTVQCICVPSWPVPWATWHSAELTHATRVANHRARAQSTQSSPPAADGNWSTRPALRFSSPAELHSHAPSTPMQSRHSPQCGECRYCFRKLCASPWRPGNVRKKHPCAAR